MPESKKAKHESEMEKLAQKFADDPEAFLEAKLEAAEKHIPSKYKKKYDLAKKLALSDHYSLQLEAIKYGENLIPWFRKLQYKRAKGQLKKKLAADAKAEAKLASDK